MHGLNRKTRERENRLPITAQILTVFRGLVKAFFQEMTSGKWELEKGAAQCVIVPLQDQKEK